MRSTTSLPRPSRKVFGAVMAAALLLTAPVQADETCQSPYMAKLTSHEDFVYVWTLGREGMGDGSDKLVTIDARPDSKTYGEVVNTVVSGERPLAAMVHQYHALTAAAKGAPLRVITPDEGVPVGYTYLSIAADAPAPDAAKKFIDFALGQEAQTVWQNNYFTVSLRDDAPALGAEYGAVPLSQVKRLASSRDDHMEYFQQNAMLSDEWSTLFK